jgi:hypothetical protein
MAFEYICRNFLANKKSENYSEIVQELISSYSVARCNLCLKLRFLHSYLDLFLENIGSISDERGESFPQYISQTEKRYSGKWNRNMSAEYCWSLIREKSTGEDKRQKKTK